MPKLSSQFKHEEPELNSSLQIRSQKERRTKSEKNGTLQEFLQGCENFATCRISQVAKFHKIRKRQASYHYSPPLRTIQVFSTVPAARLTSSLFVLFFVFFILSPCNNVWICNFW